MSDDQKEERGEDLHDDLRDAIESAAGEEAEELVEEQPGAPDEEEPAQDIEPPEHWSQLDKDAFKELPPEARRLYLDKATSLEKGYNEKFEGIASRQKEIEALDEVFAPLASQLALHGIDRMDVMRRLVGAHQYLTSDPEGAVRWLAQQYGQEHLLAGSDDAEWGLHDPRDQEIQNLKQQLAELRQGFQGFQGQYQTSQNAALQQQIEAFRNARDPEGNAKYPYFDDVRTQMGQLINSGAAQSLEQAYDMAVWAHGGTRERLLQAEQQKAAREAEAKRRAEAEKARKASAARTAGTSRGTPGKGLTTEDALREAFRQAS